MQALQLLSKIEPGVYILIGLCAVFFIWRFTQAWQDLQGAAFGLEKERAQEKLNQSAGILVALLTSAVVIFVLVSFVAPAAQSLALPTPTFNPLATATATLPPGVPTYTPAPGAELTQAAQTGPATPVGVGCVAGQIEISAPQPGASIKGIVAVFGTANIANFGFYKFEIKRPNETVWLTIQAGNTPKTNDRLGEWDTTRLTPGEYQLGLVVVDNQAQASPPCTVQLRVERAPDTTSTP